MRTLTALLLLSLAVGCAQTRTYQVSVTNHTQSPITFGVVKHGDPYEREWAAPEEIEAEGGHASAELWAAIPPGKTAVSEELKGRFGRNAIAYLRVFQGKLDLAGIMAIGRGQPNRLDIVLAPGMNKFVIINLNGRFEAVHDVPPTGQASAR
ncbi:MAG TPA: hypothetical protein VIM11_26910 [Tepidisphaeraceae bacterium]|jgi:hypothetical protein